MAMLRRVSAESTGAENFMLLLVIAILPGIAEEVLFRGFVQRGFERSCGPWRAVLLSSLLFSLFHMNPIQMVGALGSFLGLLPTVPKLCIQLCFAIW